MLEVLRVEDRCWFIMSHQDISDCEKDVIETQSIGEKNFGNHALTQETSHPELTRLHSNALSRIVSRLSTRDLDDPGPPPDGGLQAWTQVAMGFITCFCTWYVNVQEASDCQFTDSQQGDS